MITMIIMMADNKADADPQLLHNWQISRQFLASLSPSLSLSLIKMNHIEYPEIE